MSALNQSQSYPYLQIWKISQKHVRNAFRFRRGISYNFDFSPDSRHIAIAIVLRGTWQIRIYSMRGGSQKTLKVSEEEDIDSMCFSTDGRHIAVGMRNGYVLLWNVRSGHLVVRLVGHQNGVYALAFSPDGAGLVSGGHDGTVRFWDISSIRIDRSGLQDVVNNVGEEVWQWNRTVVEFIIDHICADFFTR